MEGPMGYERRTSNLQTKSGNLENCSVIVELRPLKGVALGPDVKRQSASGEGEMEN
jgi:hypothetical protein